MGRELTPAGAVPRNGLGIIRRLVSSAQRRLHRFGAFGAGSIIRPPYTIVSASCIFIGDEATIGPNALLSVIMEHNRQRYQPRLSIGDRCSVGQNFVVGCIDNIAIGDDVLISSNVFVGDCIHGFRDPQAPIIDQPLERRGRVLIEDGAFLGINSVILPGVHIGRNAVVGAGAVVTDDVPSYAVVAGNPARVIRQFDEATRAWPRLRTHERSTAA